MFRTIIVLLVYLQLFFSGVQAAESIPGIESKRILLLYSYHPTFPTSPKVLVGVRSAFGETSPIIDIEYMDSKRLYDQTSRTNYLQMFKHKVQARLGYDLVITADDNALDFILENGSILFPKVPVVFLGVNNVSKALSQNSNPNITGVVEASSFKETIELSMLLQPERVQLNLVVDSTTSGLADLQSVNAIVDLFPEVDFNILSLSDLSWDEFGAGLKKLGEHDQVLLLSAYRDKADTALSFQDSLALIRGNTGVPIYHLWEHGMGEGVLGGVLVNHREQGYQAGLMAKRILQGTNISGLPVLARSPNVPTFDYRLISQFQIDPDRLPKDSDVLFQPESVFALYRVPILVMSPLFVLMGLFILYLARQNAIRQQLADDARSKNEYLRLLMNTIPDMVWMKDNQGVYLFCNRRFEEFFGAQEPEILGKTDYDFVGRELADFFREKDIKALNAGASSMNEEEVVYASDGHKELLETVKTPLLGLDGKPVGVLGVARDITDRKQAEAAIQEQEQVVRDLLNSTAEAIYGLDLEGNCTFANPACLRMLGYSDVDKLLGKNMHTLTHHTHPDGSDYAIEECLIFRAFKTGKGIHMDSDVLWRSDGSSFPAEYWSYPISRQGRVTGAVVTFLDITERQNLDKSLRRAQKMDAIGQLTGGIAHDFNNILGIILGNLVFLERIVAGQDKALKRVESINKAAQRAADLTTQLLGFARPQATEV